MRTQTRWLRYAVSRWLVAMGTWALLRLAPRPPADALPDETMAQWTVTRPGEAPDAECMVMFVPSILPHVRFHVWALWPLPDGDALAFDGGTQEMIYHIKTRNVPLERLRRSMKIQHMVKVRFKAGEKQTVPDDSIGPMTCVTLAKRVAGIDDSSVHTPEQLLASLWRNRDGWSNGCSE